MTEAEAQALVESIEQLWQYDFEDDGRQIWREALRPYDSALAAIAVQRLRERQRTRPTIMQFRITFNELEAGRHAKPVVEHRPVWELVCSTCGDEGWIVVSLRPAEASVWMKERNLQASGVYEEMGPCPDCATGIANEYVAYGDEGYWRGREDMKKQAQAARRKQFEGSIRKEAIPEWVRVWAWCRYRRDPVETRSFPQQHPHADEPYLSGDEYQALAVEWREAGRPTVPIPNVVTA